jgi:hypothetical protein
MEKNNHLIKDALIWGVLLWLFGYILGIILFMMLPASLIGWVITPIASAVTIWVLLRKVKSSSLRYYLIVAIAWTAIAIILDYIFIVKALKPADGYYKTDVYIYYTLTFLLPLIVGWSKLHKILSHSTTHQPQ